MHQNKNLTKEDIIYACQVIEHDHQLLDKLLDIFVQQAVESHLKGVEQFEAENEIMRQVFADQAKLDEAHRVVFDNMTPNEKYQDNLADVVGFMQRRGYIIELKQATEKLGELCDPFCKFALEELANELEDYYSFSDGRGQVDLSHITTEHTLRDIVTSIFGNYPREEK